MSQKPNVLKRQQSVTQKGGKYWEKLKNVEVQKISQYKTKESNIKMRHYWSDIIREMERLAMQQAEQTKIKINDLSTSLPPKLHKRISKIIPLNPIETDIFEDEFEENQTKQVLSKMSVSQMDIWKPEVFNESTCTITKKEEKIYQILKVQIEQQPEKKKVKKYPKNWQSEYLCQKQKDRIKWNSKLYEFKTDIWEKPLYEQAEELMDTSAESFLEWLNDLSKISETNMTKDLLLNLFSLELNRTLAKGLETNPKVLAAVPAQIALALDMPEKAVQLQMENKLHDIQKKLHQNVKTHAFGTTLPEKMRPWKSPDSYHIIKPDIPKDLLHCKVIFQGITHLRSTKKFIDHCIVNPLTEKPQYLKRHGCFNKYDKSKSSYIYEPPLTELLQLTS